MDFDLSTSLFDRITRNESKCYSDQIRVSYQLIDSKR